MIVGRLGDQHVGVHYRVWVGGWLWINMGFGMGAPINRFSCLLSTQKNWKAVLYTVNNLYLKIQ